LAALRERNFGSRNEAKTRRRAGRIASGRFLITPLSLHVIVPSGLGRVTPDVRQPYSNLTRDVRNGRTNGKAMLMLAPARLP
jgi:hypothetical protein